MEYTEKLEDGLVVDKRSEHIGYIHSSWVRKYMKILKDKLKDKKPQEDIEIDFIFKEIIGGKLC